MIEIRIHGRGGQGSVIMAELLAEAAFYGGWQAQAFPSFGAERLGAPVAAFVRLDKKPIRLRSQVYSPDYLIVQDATLLNDKDFFSDAKSGTIVLINSASVDKLIFPKNIKVKSLDAKLLALEILGRPIINTILLGAFAGMTRLIELAAVEKAIRERFSGELADKNIEAAKKGFEVIANN
jgi:pyruvate ferredoxin oxidoreductase gamma subunit